jgi:hypothetical protein
MKFTSILAIVACAAVVSAAPHWNHEDNSNKENKSINQGIGSVGSTKNGLLGGLLGGGILSSTTNNNYVSQNAKND